VPSGVQRGLTTSISGRKRDEDRLAPRGRKLEAPQREQILHSEFGAGASHLCRHASGSRSHFVRNAGGTNFQDFVSDESKPIVIGDLLQGGLKCPPFLLPEDGLLRVFWGPQIDHPMAAPTDAIIVARKIGDQVARNDDRVAEPRLPHQWPLGLHHACKSLLNDVIDGVGVGYARRYDPADCLGHVLVVTGLGGTRLSDSRKRLPQIADSGPCRLELSASYKLFTALPRNEGAANAFQWRSTAELGFSFAAARLLRTFRMAAATTEEGHARKRADLQQSGRNCAGPRRSQDRPRGGSTWMPSPRTGVGTHQHWMVRRQGGLRPLQNATKQSEDIVVAYDEDLVKGAPTMRPNGRLTPGEEDHLYEYCGLGGSDAGAPTDATGRDDVGTALRDTGAAMTRSEEELHVGTEQPERGRARLRKYVVTREVTTTVPVKREEVRLERQQITDENLDDAMAGPEISEAEHEVVLREEEPVVEKRTVPKERVRLEKGNGHR
jgi:uncharacterized protein (TIGR02271 family)